MVLPSTPTVDRLQRRIQPPDYQQWRAMVESPGGCAHPVRLTGMWQIADTATGSVLAHRSGHIFAPCGNRRESVCPACSDRYAADAFHLVRAGMSGGTKGVPVAVADKPRLFVTLTAPSFGPVHNRPTRHGKRIPCRCGIFHHEYDLRLGQPIEPRAYDYTGHVLWQAHAGALWHRFVIYLRRYLAKAVGIRVQDFKNYARLSYAKVAEFQRRGIIHFHAVIRLDGPQGAADKTPAWGSIEVLADAVRTAAAAVSVTTPEVSGRVRELVFGDQIDVRPTPTRSKTTVA